MNKSISGKLGAATVIALLALPVAAAVVSLAIGRYGLSLPELARALTAGPGGYAENPQAGAVVWVIRLPRIALALLVGAGLSTAGTAFQSLFRNPLATPDTLGVASGASFGAALALLMGFGLIAVQILALIFGTVAVLLTFVAGGGHDRTTVNTTVLAGIVIGSVFSALVSFVKYVADTQSVLPAITYWLLGSLSGASWSSLLLGAPPIIIGCTVLFALRWRINVLPLSDDEAKASGTNIRALRIVTVICATMITASCVSMCGQVGWVGLLVPHLCRMRYGNNNRALIPASLLAGAAFMVAIDTVARSLIASELPVSVLTALVGAPFFIILLRRSRGWSL